ncbi:MAG: FtsH protease activity modulator HflK [Zetaproteobacteria bacterium]|nr:MAG: FtsH protease activity modulator HflK [Zetaproteobacteria bacterium]
MPWSDPNQQNNPWGRRPSGGQTPPDLDEMIRRLQERFSGVFGGGPGGGRSTPSWNKGMMGALVGIIFLIWAASGFYMVAADEEAVVLRFGKHVATKGPGLNWHFPYPIETVEKLPVTRVQRLEIGMRRFPDGTVRKRTDESLMLTKDENIVDISFIVQYKIKNVEDYLFNIDAPMKTVRDAAESAIREVIGRTLIDDVLTSRKAEVEVETEKLIQSILDGYEAGITVTTVKLQDVQPPERVIKEFKDVASAREDRERAKNEAEAYANDIIPKARGEAKKMVLDAQAYRKDVVERAKGEAQRFKDLLREYRKAPEVTRKRLYLETMQEVLEGMDKIIVDRSVADKVLPYLPLDRRKVEVK